MVRKEGGGLGDFMLFLVEFMIFVLIEDGWDGG